LEAIRTLFTNQMVSYTENVGYEGEAVWYISFYQ
jgi:hypothetical protein